MATLLRASGLGFGYGDHFALRGVDVSLDGGEILALLGPNGSGKSTLIKSLLGQLNASGKIEWEGKAIAAWNRRELARRIAYLPQSPGYLPEHTVADVLRLGRSPYWSAFGIESPRDQQVVMDVSGQMGLADLLDRPMDELSGGQRQRVFVGRCLVQEPAAILLDEPAAHLDLRHHVELCELLRKLAREKSIGVLMASHDLNLAAAVSDRVILLENGTVAASGNTSVLETDLLSRIYGIAMDKLTGPGGEPVFMPRLNRTAESDRSGG